MLQAVDFNSHAHVERDPVTHAWCVTQIHFNSHAHVERDGFSSKVCLDHMDFNSHAHVERDSKALPLNGVSTISTHTLTWSVTDTTFVKCVVWGISTHTLTWSVTHHLHFKFFFI